MSFYSKTYNVHLFNRDHILFKIITTLKKHLIIWGCSSVVERSLCMWKARGSIPRISKYLFLSKYLIEINHVTDLSGGKVTTENQKSAYTPFSCFLSCNIISDSVILTLTCKHVRKHAYNKFWRCVKSMEMRGIEPRAFHMQSERSTTELQPHDDL